MKQSLQKQCESYPKINGQTRGGCTLWIRRWPTTRFKPNNSATQLSIPQNVYLALHLTFFVGVSTSNCIA